MLSHLRIKDFAIIEDADIQFGKGFTVITGETGAGKSILIEAITLLLGSRGDTEFIRNRCEELTVEGIFEHGQKELLVKRTLNLSGRSKIYINSELATLNQLKDATKLLVDISGQHQHQMLLNEEFHTEILDRFASDEEILAEYRHLREEYLSLIQELIRLENLAKEKDSRLDFLRFQRQELSEAAVRKDEYDTLLQESNILRNGAKFQQILSETLSLLSGDDRGISAVLGKLRKKLNELSLISKDFEPFIRDIEEAGAVLSELEKSISDKLSRTDFSGERLDAVESKLHRIKRICEKYRITPEEILTRLRKTETEINDLENSEIATKDTRKRIEQVSAMLIKKAERLHQVRIKSSEEISKRCEDVFQKLGLRGSGIRFEILFEPPSDIYDRERFGENGFDRVRILFAPNVGEEFRPLSKIASGGELSRVMLAFKSVVSERDIVGTYIFDEVDAGIGGAVAESVGMFLKGLSKTRQVICITHLPQIASLGDEHYTVEKVVQNKRTTIKIKKLSDKERIEEIARMLGGHTITEKNRAYARELLEKYR
ncbi:MAG: DNA repair protein RecN [Deltaproteobacteria bacterium]|nr:DNA repair protein RecN [Deltaproteobacteria bacterium]